MTSLARAAAPARLAIVVAAAVAVLGPGAALAQTTARRGLGWRDRPAIVFGDDVFVGIRSRLVMDWREFDLDTRRGRLRPRRPPPRPQGRPDPAFRLRDRARDRPRRPVGGLEGRLPALGHLRRLCRPRRPLQDSLRFRAEPGPHRDRLRLPGAHLDRADAGARQGHHRPRSAPRPRPHLRGGRLRHRWRHRQAQAAAVPRHGRPPRADDGRPGDGRRAAAAGRRRLVPARPAPRRRLHDGARARGAQQPAW